MSIGDFDANNMVWSTTKNVVIAPEENSDSTYLYNGDPKTNASFHIDFNDKSLAPKIEDKDIFSDDILTDLADITGDYYFKEYEALHKLFEIDYKYNEGEALRKITEYVNSTYGQHYVGTGGNQNIQTIDFWESLGSLESTCRDTAIKYLARYGKKDGRNEKDLLKAIHYIILMMYAKPKVNEVPKNLNVVSEDDV